MICSILEFLNASPMTLFQGEPSDPDDRDKFFQDNFESFMACMVVADESVRRLAIGVAPHLFTEDTVARYCGTSQLATKRFKTTFWKLTYVSLSCCEHTLVSDSGTPDRLFSHPCVTRSALTISMPDSSPFIATSSPGSCSSNQFG